MEDKNNNGGKISELFGAYFIEHKSIKDSKCQSCKRMIGINKVRIHNFSGYWHISCFSDETKNLRKNLAKIVKIKSIKKDERERIAESI